MEKLGPIGVFDSGIGGLTIAKAISELMPNEQLYYFGDTAHLPYGDKSAAAIQAYSIKICNVLLEQNCKAIVIACNSASAAAYELVKEYVGSRAIVLNVIDPVVEYVVNNFQTKNVGLIGTRQTILSEVYTQKLNKRSPQTVLKSLATPLLAPMIEEGYFDNTISHQIIEEYLKAEAISNIEALILGCTHYPLIKKEIIDYYSGNVAVLDAPKVVSVQLKQLLQERELLIGEGNREHQFLVSDYTESFKHATSLFFGQEVNLKHYPLWE